MSVAPLSNGGSELFKRSLDALAEHADDEFEAQRSLFESGRISGQQFERAVAAFCGRAVQLQRMWKEWVGDSA
jgi:hypothetical protein